MQQRRHNDTTQFISDPATRLEADNTPESKHFTVKSWHALNIVALVLCELSNQFRGHCDAIDDGRGCTISSSCTIHLLRPTGAY